MDNIYRQHIMDHYQFPRRRGRIAQATASAHDSNPVCGDDLTLDLRLDEQGRVADCRFEGRGCAISMAAADLLCQHAVGKSAQELVAMSHDQMVALLGIELGPVRIKCGLLALKVAKLALVQQAAAVHSHTSGG